MRNLSHFVKSSGVFAILSICVACILLGHMTRDIPERSAIKKYINIISNLESRFYDFRAKPHLKNNKKDSDIVLIKLDDKSLQKIGSWPLPRDIWANMISKLESYGAKVIAFDVLFPEEVKACGVESPDQNLADAIENFQSKDDNRVVLAYTVQEVGAVTPHLQETPLILYNTAAATKHSSEKAHFSTKFIESHTWPIEKLLMPEPDLGYLNMKSDNDGVFRRYQVVANIQEVYFPSLGYAAYQAFTQTSPDISINNQSIGSLNINDNTLELNSNGETKIKWIGGSEKFDDISLYRVIEGVDYNRLSLEFLDSYGIKKEFLFEIMKDENGKEFIDLPTEKDNSRAYITNKDNKKFVKINGLERELKQSKVILKELFKNKIVFVGSTAVGAHDLRNTPIDAQLPGVYAHMNFVNMLLTQNFYQPEDTKLSYSLSIFGIGLIVLLITMFFGNAILDLVMVLTISCVILYLDYSIYIPADFDLALFFSLVGIISTYSWITFLNFNQASAEKKHIKGAFSRYVAPAIVDDMLDNPDKLKVGGERKDITCMFSDVRDFTSISENLTPTQLATALNRYMGEMTDIVFETNGTLDKYIGDAIVAFWGAPIDIGDHVNQAIDASIKMLEALPKINEEFKAKGLPEFKIGLGLNSGICSVGNMGSDQIFAYTALGDNMNLGARLESLCKHYGAEILISEYTYEKMNKDKFNSRLIDKVRVKGKTEPVGVYEVLYSYHPFEKDKESLNHFKQAYEHYVAGNFEEAKGLFEVILKKHPTDKSSVRLSIASQKWINSPPLKDEDWIITTMETK